MIILFTGHRDKHADEFVLDKIREKFGGNENTWLHGGAVGVDSDVHSYVQRYGLQEKVVRPDYNKYFWRVAPLIRDKEMVNECDFVVAFYDGRLKGGTLATINYAKESGTKVYIFLPKG
jgi:predicted Rossmann fold nucleotide-binding protein DprA/Smf involved in DNA uptake